MARAAAILGASRCAVVAGLATDIAGIEAAVALARRIGGVMDHMHADAALRDLEVMRQHGWIVTTPLQARARADLLVLVGPGIAAAWPNFAERLAMRTPPALHPERRVGSSCSASIRTRGPPPARTSRSMHLSQTFQRCWGCCARARRVARSGPALRATMRCKAAPAC